MQDALLRHFPARVYPLTLVSDPDDQLADEQVLGALADRGFTLIAEADPVMLRVRIEQVRPWTPERAVIVVTPDDLRGMPYDLWCEGHHVTLSLHDSFPMLSYPIVRLLSPAQRARLAETPQPPSMLGELSSIDFMLRHLFGIDAALVREPAELVSWLITHHSRHETMPERLRERLLSQLRGSSALAAFDLPTLLSDANAFGAFMRGQWSSFVQQSTGHAVEEPAAPYILDFERNPGLQDGIPTLLRTGLLEPVAVDAPDHFPDWSRPAVRATSDDARALRADALLEQLELALSGSEAVDDWNEWETIADSWAELTVIRFDEHRHLDIDERTNSLQASLDEQFITWLQRRYSPLSGLKLPDPHHVHHVPHVLAQMRRASASRRIALVVLDGMSLAAWRLIGAAWRQRHLDWSFREQRLLAQIPTITAISRQALISGRRPEQFADSIANNTKEPQRWKQFWRSEDVPELAISSRHLNLDTQETIDLPDAGIRALYWIESGIDTIVHGATLGMADVFASIRLWIEQRSPTLEAGIEQLLKLGFRVMIASDHGHVEAYGSGMLREGLAVETKGNRARTYVDASLAANACEARPETIVWHADGVLPDDLWVLMPTNRTAFAPRGTSVVTHGGLTIDEVIVPLITIDLTGNQ